MFYISLKNNKLACKTNKPSKNITLILRMRIWFLWHGLAPSFPWRCFAAAARIDLSYQLDEIFYLQTWIETLLNTGVFNKIFKIIHLKNSELSKEFIGKLIIHIIFICKISSQKIFFK